MSSLVERHGSAKHHDRPVAHQRPDGMTDDTVAALGKLSEALEVVEQARGALYEFHRLSGMADLTLQQAVDELRAAGHADLAGDIEQTLVGRDVVGGLWTFQIVEAYDRQYWQVFRDVELSARHCAGHASAHLLEVEMKHREQHPRRRSEKEGS
jgi:hypothetical protein